MAYDYDTDILAALWTGGEDGEEPYATLIANNPDLFDEDSENRILSTIEAVRAHMELLADRDEARLFHFCLSTMLEGFGSGGFIYGSTSDNENVVVEGNVPNPVYAATDDIEFATLSGVSGDASISVVAAGGTTLDDLVAAINGDGGLTAAGITAARTPDARLRIIQEPVGGATRAAGFVITQGEGGANDLAVANSGISLQAPGNRFGLTQAGLNGGIFLPKVIEVANKARDRALQVYVGQIRDPALV